MDRICPLCGSNIGRVKYLEPPFRIVKCSGCSFVYLANPPDETALYEEYHTRVQATVDDYRMGSPNRAMEELYAINEQRLAMIRSVKPAGSLLDLGCGRGYFMKTAGKNGFRVSGIDVSEAATRYACDTLGVSASTDSLDQLLARQKQFDVITAWHVLEHFINPIGTLRVLRSLLADGGVCFVEVPNRHSLKFLVARDKWTGGNHPLYHRSFFSQKTLRHAFYKAGFSEVDRIRLSYRVPGRNRMYESGKTFLNMLALDAFLDFRAGK